MNDRGLSELLKLAGRRVVPDEHHLARARAAAHAEWKRVALRRRWSRALWASPIAAAVVTAVIAPAWFSSHPAPTPGAGPAEALAQAEVATLQMVTGAITVTSPNGEATRPTRPGLRLRTGDRVETARDSRAIFVLTGGTSVKVDRNTRVSLERGVLALEGERGGLYVDADPQANDRDVVVRTQFATVRHLGTQFQVRLDGRAVRVLIREGEVAMDVRGVEWKAGAGESMQLTADRDPVRGSITAYGSEWNWVAELPRLFTLEGSTLRAFLDWASREMGRRWQYQDQSMSSLSDIGQRGQIEGLTAEEALDMVLESNGLSFRKTKDGRLVIVPR